MNVMARVRERLRSPSPPRAQGDPTSLASFPPPALSSRRPEVPLPFRAPIPPLPAQANQPSEKDGWLGRDGRSGSGHPGGALEPKAGPRMDGHALRRAAVSPPVSAQGGRAGVARGARGGARGEHAGSHGDAHHLCSSVLIPIPCTGSMRLTS